MSGIKAVLIDLDGVIYNDSSLISGAAQTISWLREKHFILRFLTNTTMKSRESLQQKLQKFGIECSRDEIFSAAYAAAQFIRHSGKKDCFAILTEDAAKDYIGINLYAEKPDYVIVGDIGKNYNFDILNTAFQKLFSGAELIALQKNRFWLSDGGYTLDAGAFVALLEYAAGCESSLIGKPSRAFFETVLEEAGVSKAETIMVGDDIESDIAGAQNLGIRAILVKTGKFRLEDLVRDDIKPWKSINSIADLPELIDNIKRE